MLSDFFLHLISPSSKSNIGFAVNIYFFFLMARKLLRFFSEAITTWLESIMWSTWSHHKLCRYLLHENELGHPLYNNNKNNKAKQPTNQPTSFPFWCLVVAAVVNFCCLFTILVFINTFFTSLAHVLSPTAATTTTQTTLVVDSIDDRGSVRPPIRNQTQLLLTSCLWPTNILSAMLGAF